MSAAAQRHSDETTRLVVKLREERAGSMSVGGGRANALAALQRRAGFGLQELRRTATGATVLGMERPMSMALARAAARRIALDPGVEYAEPDARVNAQAVSTPNDSFASLQWPLSDGSTKFGGSAFLSAWAALPTQSPRITVAVLDTGALPHPDLVAQDLGGFDFIGDLDVAADGGARDDDPTDPGDYCDSSGSKSSWHGLATESIVAASAANGRGIAGAAGNRANVLSVRVLGRCGGWLSDTADAMVWASGGAVAGVPVNGSKAQVISMSLGSPAGMPCPQYMQDAVNAALARGSVLVAAAGNEGASALASPANCAGVISVGAHTLSGDLAGYSNRSAALTLTAPGGGGCATQGADCDNTPVVALGNTGLREAASYTDARYFAGTSAATPHVAAAVALMLVARPDLTPAQVASALRSSARRHAASSFCAQPSSTGLCGAGMLDAAAAIAAVSGPLLTVTGPAGYIPGHADVALAVAAAGNSGPYTYNWRQVRGESVTLATTTEATLNFKAPATRAASPDGLYFEVTVTAANGVSSTTGVALQLNNAPVLDITDATGTPGTAFTKTLVARDVDGDRVTISLLQGPQGAVLNGDTLTWPNPTMGRAEFVIQADDGMLSSAPATFYVDVASPATQAAGGSGGGSVGLAWLLALMAAVGALGIGCRPDATSRGMPR